MEIDILNDRSRVVLRYILEKHAEHIPEKECIVFEDGEKWTYKKALAEAYRSANALSQLGIKRGDRVMIFLPNGKDWILAWWGATILGAIFVPINTSYKGEMLRHNCMDAQTRYIITTPDLVERLKYVGLDLDPIDPSIFSKGSSDPPQLDSPLEPWDVHAILYTSGTTGPSKGVLVPFFKTYFDVYFFWEKRGTQEDTMLVDLPLFHVGPFQQAYSILTIGGRMLLREVFSGSRYWDLIRDHGVTMALMVGTVPAFLERSDPKPNDADNPLRVAFCGPMVSDPAAFKERFGIKDLFSMFGQTETCDTFMTEEEIIYPKSCGKVVKGVQVRLVDDHDIPVPTGQVGELIVRNELPWAMNIGYFNRPEETAKAWRNGWFHTGDMCRCDEEGNYFYVDRKKDAIRRRGENISSFEVEREVMNYPDVKEAACVATPGEFGEDEVKVFIIPREGSQIDPVKLIEYLIPRMPYYMIPRYVEVLPDFPKTANMKVKKVELRARGNSLETWDREAAGIVIRR